MSDNETAEDGGWVEDHFAEILGDHEFPPRPDASESGAALTPLRTREVRRYTTGAVFGCAIAVDRIGQRFDVLQVNAGGDAWIEVYKHNPQGVEVAGWRVDPDPEPPVGANKADNVCGIICRSPAPNQVTFLRVGTTSHWTAESTGRPYIWGICDIMDSGAVFDPDNPAHADNVLPIPAAINEGGPITQADAILVATEVKAQLREEIATSRTNNMRPWLRDLTRDAMIGMSDPANYRPFPNPGNQEEVDAKRWQDIEYSVNRNRNFGQLLELGVIALENPGEPDPSKRRYSMKAAMFAILDEYYASKQDKPV